MKRRAIVAIVLACLAVAPGSVPVAPSVASAGPAGIEEAIRRAEDWVATVRVGPFAGTVRSFRRFALETEIWHRLWRLAPTDAERARFAGEVRSRLQRVLDRQRLQAILELPEGTDTFTEMLILADRCRTHGLDPAPIAEAMSNHRGALRSEIDRAPPSIQALYAVYLEAVGSPIRLDREEVLSRGMLVRRPREADLTLADVYYLTHEVFALCDYGLSPMRSLSEEAEAYLLRVLPFYTLFYGRLQKNDIVGELLVCLHAAGMRDTYAYREGIRLLLERQAVDGSFGDGPSTVLGGEPSDRLHATLNAVTALALERGTSDAPRSAP
ncbi:MAG: hypothetical protein GF346_00155 [Candidatus Eisenbacteria bacterium]|nr:hypothetical protein [Candidatus Latescibacterota bacterium]MBD3300844.1 hypothetical protein [Candidatus Eisenbacteria bacterium]